MLCDTIRYDIFTRARKLTKWPTSFWHQFFRFLLTYSFTHNFFTTLYIYNSITFTPDLKPTLSQILPLVVSHLPPELPPRTFIYTCTVSSELFGFWSYFFLIFSFMGRALGGHLVSFWAHVNLPYRIVSYLSLAHGTETTNYGKTKNKNRLAQKKRATELKLGGIRYSCSNL